MNCQSAGCSLAIGHRLKAVLPQTGNEMKNLRGSTAFIVHGANNVTFSM